MQEEYFDLDGEYELEDMISAMRESLPSRITTILDIQKFYQVMKVINVIVESIKRQCETAKIKVRFDCALGIDMMLDVITDYIGIDTDAVKLLKDLNCDVISAISVINRTDGNLGLTILFEDVKILVS